MEVHDLSPDQAAALEAVLAWWRERRSQVLTVGGYAGTGKTTLLGAVAGALRAEPAPPRIAFCCFTGKASIVLRDKLWRAKALHEEYCGTIHGLIYQARTDERGRILGWRLREPHEVEADLFVLDEASMVDAGMLDDLKSYGRPILAVGDHGQLPPVSGTVNLMERPDVRLERVHRQAEGNPIIRVSMMAREGRRVPFDSATGGDGSVTKAPRGTDVLGKLDSLRATMLICGTNAVRMRVNAAARKLLGYAGEPRAGDKVICLRNNRRLGIFNGMLGNLLEIAPSGEDHYRARILMDGGLDIEEVVFRHQFGQPKTINDWPGILPFAMGERFDFGYALTCHKAQGSEASTVVVYEDCDWLRDEEQRRRWLYTAYTRAARRLVIVGT